MNVEVFFNRPGEAIPLERFYSEVRHAEITLHAACAWFTLDPLADAILDSTAQKKLVLFNHADLQREQNIGQRIWDRFVSEATHGLHQHGRLILRQLGTSDFRTGIMHHKFIVIDRSVVWTGSYNPTWQAAKNYEALLRIDGAEIAGLFAREAEALFDGDQAVRTIEELLHPLPRFRTIGVEIPSLDPEFFTCRWCGAGLPIARLGLEEGYWRVCDECAPKVLEQRQAAIALLEQYREGADVR